MEIKKRLFEDEITNWYQSTSGDALVVTGARQVGKTTGVLNWAKNNNIRIVYYDMMQHQELIHPLATASSYEKVIDVIAIDSNLPKDQIDVIFIDEAQVDKNILYLARLFKHKPIKLILSGSLLTTKLSLSVKRTDVGSKQYLRVFPLDFKEFLIWTGNDRYLSLIDEAFEKKEQILANFHQKLIELYQQYLLVGGMPEVVSMYVTNGNKILDNVYKKKQNIIQEYIKDNKDGFNMDEGFNKATSETLNIIYNNISTFVILPKSKKFCFDEARKGFKYKNFAAPLNIIKNCNIVLFAYNIEGTTFPLSIHKLESSFKLYYSDVGLLTSKLQLTEKSLQNWCQENTSSDVWGGVFENAIACDLQKEELYFKKWSQDGNGREIDFVVQWENDEVYPVEVKSKPKNARKAKSLKEYNESFQPKKNIVIGPNNFHWDDKKIMIPLYAAYKLRSYIK